MIAILVAFGPGDVSAAAETSSSSTPPASSCQPYAVLPVDSGLYDVQTNEWNSTATQCVSTDGGPDFAVTDSSIQTSGSAPGSYPSIYQGCNWGRCTADSALPVQVAQFGDAHLSWSINEPGSGVYDAALDIWFNDGPTAASTPHGTEMMVWLSSRGAGPAGHEVGVARLDGYQLHVWYDGHPGATYVAYVIKGGTSSVSNLDLGNLVLDAESRGYLDPSYYLIAVEAGFELWRGGAGLATKSFSFHADPYPGSILSGGLSAAVITTFTRAQDLSSLSRRRGDPNPPPAHSQ